MVRNFSMALLHVLWLIWHKLRPFLSHVTWTTSSCGAAGCEWALRCEFLTRQSHRSCPSSSTCLFCPYVLLQSHFLSCAFFFLFFFLKPLPIPASSVTLWLQTEQSDISTKHFGHIFIWSGKILAGSRIINEAVSFPVWRRCLRHMP